MKKALLVLSAAALLMLGTTGSTLSQDQPKPQKDTVNMDTDAKPTFYYATEDEKAAESKGSPVALIAIICGGVVVVAGIVLFVLKRKKQ